MHTTGMVTASEDVAITSGLFATDGRDRNHGTPLALHTCYKFPSVPLPLPPCSSSPPLAVHSFLTELMFVRSARKTLLWEQRHKALSTSISVDGRLRQRLRENQRDEGPSIYKDEDQLGERNRINENQLNDERDKLVSICLILASMGNLTLLRSNLLDWNICCSNLSTLQEKF